MASTTTVLAEVQARNPKKNWLWLRVPWKQAKRIILVSDDALPYGEKTATLVEIEMGEIRPEGPGGVYTAEVEFIRNASPAD